MPAPVVVAGAEPAHEGAVLLVQGATTSITDRAAEPGTDALPASEGPFLLELDDLGVAVEGDGNLRPAQASDVQHRVVFQELMVEPFPPNVAGPERCDHGS